MITVDIRSNEKSQSMPLAARATLAEGALELEPRLDGAIAISKLEAQVGAQRLAPGARRLLRPGDVLTIGSTQFSLRADASVPQTAQLAKAMLRDAANAVPSSVPALLWLNGPELGKRVALSSEATFIGRGDGCIARLSDAQASRTHAKIVKSAHSFRLEDLMSANGIFVDGEPLKAPRMLTGREVIQIGGTLLALELPASMRAPEVKPEPKPEVRVEPPKVEVKAEPKPVEPEPKPTKPRIARLELALLSTAIVAIGAGGAVIAWALQ